jgi:hypothetical protein
MKILEGLRHASSANGTLVISLNSDNHVRLTVLEVQRILAEIAEDSPVMLHMALEERLINRIAYRVKEIGDE